MRLFLLFFNFLPKKEKKLREKKCICVCARCMDRENATIASCGGGMSASKLTNDIIEKRNNNNIVIMIFFLSWVFEKENMNCAQEYIYKGGVLNARCST